MKDIRNSIKLLNKTEKKYAKVGMFVTNYYQKFEKK